MVLRGSKFAVPRSIVQTTRRGELLDDLIQHPVVLFEVSLAAEHFVGILDVPAFGQLVCTLLESRCKILPLPFKMKLQANHSLRIENEGQIPSAYTGRDERRARRQVESVAMPMERGEL